MSDNLMQRYSSSDSTTAGPLRFKDIGGVLYAVSILSDSSGNLLDTLPISAASLPLPSGAATSAEQDAGNTSLASIDGKITACNTGAVVLAAGTASFGKLAANDGVDIGDTTINNGSGASAVNIQDGGNSITIDGTLTGITNVVHIDDNASAISIDDGGGSITVDGTVAISGTVPVSDGGGSLTVDGTVAATQSGTWNITNISGTVSLPTGAATVAKQPALGTAGTASADVITVQGIASMTALKVDGSAVTQPVSVAATVTVTGAGGTFPATDSGGSLTVDAPVGTPVFVRLSDGSAEISTLPVSLVSVPSHAVTNAGTFAVQAAQSGTWNVTNVSGTISLPTGASTLAEQQTQTTSLQLIDDIVYTDDTSTHSTGASKGALIMAAATPTDSAVNANDIGAVAMTTDRKLHVSVQDALPAGTNGIGKLTANVGVTIGAVEIASAQTLATVTTVSTVTTCSTVTSITGLTGGNTAHDAAAASINPLLVGLYASAAAPSDVSADNDAVRAWALRSGAQCIQPTFAGILGVAGNGASGTGVQRVTIANDSTGVLATVSTVTTVGTLTGGGVAHDGVDSGNPIKTGARAALTLSNDTMVADGDRADNVSDADGAQIVRNQFPLGDLISERVSNTDGASTALSNFAAVASTRSYITAISVYNSSSTDGYIDFRDGTGGSVLFTVPLPALGGAILPAGAAPYFRTTANTALAFDVSGALSTVYISVSGFKSKV